MNELIKEFTSEITLSSATMTALLLLFIVVLLVMMYQIMRGDNDLKCWHFIATKGKDGKHYADLDKLGKAVGIFISSWAVILVAYGVHGSGDIVAFAAVLTAYLAYVGGVAAYSALLRTKQTYTPPQERPGEGQ